MLHVHITEFTGKKYPKTKHRFSLIGAPFKAIAGLWRDAQGNHPASFTMLTTSPGPDVAPYHDRQIVVLLPENWAAWLHLTKPQGELLTPLPEGSLVAETVRQGVDEQRAYRRDCRIEMASAASPDARATARVALLTLGAPMPVRRRLRRNTFAVLAIGELIASAKHRSVAVAPLDHLPHQAHGALAQGRAFNRLEANFIPGDLTKFPDITGGLATVGDEIHAPAGARQRDVEQASFFRVGEGFRLGNDQVEQLVVLDAARHAIVAFTHVE